MNDDIDFRLMVGFTNHSKIRKLIHRLGQQAAWNLVCLIAYARANKCDGVLTGMSAEDIEIASNWLGEPGKFTEHLKDIRFLDLKEGTYLLHDWADHQPWAMGAKARSDHGRLAALKRHHGDEEGERMFLAELARRNAQPAKPDAPSNAQTGKPDAPSKNEQAKVANGQCPVSVPKAVPTKHPPLSPLPGGELLAADDQPKDQPTPPEPPKAKRKPSGAITLRTFVDECTAAGEDAIPEGHSVFAYAASIGMPTEYLELAWLEFHSRYIDTDKKQTGKRGWRQKFENAVRGNWLRLWYRDGETWGLTTQGKQAKLAHGVRVAA